MPQRSKNRPRLNFVCRNLAVLSLGIGSTFGLSVTGEPEKPNILWLTIEDISPYGFGCYGNNEVSTPNIDALAERGVRYLHASSVAPQCSPARSSIISGSYATTYGTDLHRTNQTVPLDLYLFPQYLREIGYFTTNVNKTDYNLTRKMTEIAYPANWDLLFNNASYNNPGRKEGQPFFAVFNNMRTHMTRLVTITAEGRSIRLDPDALTLPDHVPDHPDLRSDYALHLEGAEDIDRWVGLFLDDLEKRGLADNTIIFFFSDHGGCLPRGKAFPFNTGLHVPFIVYAPPRWEHLLEKPPGSVSERLIDFTDLAPTMFSIVGLKPLPHFQGTAFMGPYKGPPKDFNFGLRSNTGPHFDPSRTANDGRYHYIRYFTPHKPHALRQTYQWQMPGQLAYDQLFLDGALDDARAQYYLPKPTEMLFDLKNDPWELHNLAEDPAHQDILKRMRDATYQHMIQSRDLGLFPPSIRFHHSGEIGIYEYVQTTDYPLEELIDAAWLAGEGDPGKIGELTRLMEHERPEMRFWGASGLITLMQREAIEDLPEATLTLLNGLLDDDFHHTSSAAAAALSYSDTERGLVRLFNAFHGPQPATSGSQLEAMGQRPAFLINRLHNYLGYSRNEGAKRFARSILINLGELPLETYFTEEEWEAGHRRARSTQWREGWNTPGP